MHARISTLRPREGELEQVVRICREVVIPAAERQEGFLGSMLTSSSEAGKVLSISLWDTEADMLATESGEYLQEQVARLITLLAGPPTIEHHRVDVLS